MPSLADRRAVLPGALLLVALSPLDLLAADVLIEAPAEPPRVLVLPPDVRVFQLGAATLQEVPEWSAEAEAHTVRALARLVEESPHFELVATPELSAEEQAVVDEHVALYELVANTAHQTVTLGGRAWKHKKQSFDYSLGPGLRFLRERSGADQALLTVAADTEATGGRIGMALLAAAAGVAIPLGNTFFMTGLVDLETGNIDWLNHRMAGTNLRVEDNVLHYLDDLLCAYPNGRVSGGKVKGCGRKFNGGVAKDKR